MLFLLQHYDAQLLDIRTATFFILIFLFMNRMFFTNQWNLLLFLYQSECSFLFNYSLEQRTRWKRLSIFENSYTQFMESVMHNIYSKLATFTIKNKSNSSYNINSSLSTSFLVLYLHLFFEFRIFGGSISRHDK